jgi:predicted transcriptional regulator
MTDSRERLFQRAYLLQQVMESPEQQLAKGKANRFPRAIARELRLTPTIANELRDDLVGEGHLRTLKKSGSIVYELTDQGKTYLATLEQKTLPEGRKPVREGPVSSEVQLARKTFLLFQLFEAPNQTLEQKEANRFREPGRKFLALSASAANRVRKELAEQGMIDLKRDGRNATYRLMQAGIEFLGASSSFPEAEFAIHGRVLNDLLEAARESARQFQVPQTTPEREEVAHPV